MNEYSVTVTIYGNKATMKVKAETAVQAQEKAIKKVIELKGKVETKLINYNPGTKYDMPDFMRKIFE